MKYILIHKLAKSTIEFIFCLCLEFNKAGVDINKPIIATCGSGVTACWIAFAASLLGKEIPVYDVRGYLFELLADTFCRDHGQNMLSLVLKRQ